ncbi:unnamed protein product [Hyaloperonospora brassicae]|uniref:RxLR effector candidate protein n=1 Tax=Hyaloperonospora brassicae TaxID=162125 RepID=A0AAV0V429_HYABA|nr:unnamed protein product [Hyaloperonospora brassicae]
MMTMTVTAVTATGALMTSVLLATEMNDKDSRDDKGDVYSQKAGGGTKRRSGDDDDMDSRENDDVYGMQPSVYRN